MSDSLSISITLPGEIAALLGAPGQVNETARRYIILGLFQDARISSGKAAELLGFTSRGFIALLRRNEIPYFRLDPGDWDSEVARIRASHRSGL